MTYTMKDRMIFAGFALLWIAADKLDLLIAWINDTFRNASYKNYHQR